MRIISLLALTALVACGDKDDDSGHEHDHDTGEADAEDTTAEADFSCEAPAATECSEDYGFCGNIKVPEDFTGTPRSLAVALYTSIPPAGPPNATLTEIEAPELVPGTCYTVEIHPMLEQGEYYLWVNLYMEGGGSWVPVNDIDYTANSAAPLSLDGSATIFEDLTLQLASGW